jgi:hypothetical protein
MEKEPACNASQGLFQFKVSFIVQVVMFMWELIQTLSLAGLQLLPCPLAHQTCRVFLNQMMMIYDSDTFSFAAFLHDLDSSS